MDHSESTHDDADTAALDPDAALRCARCEHVLAWARDLLPPGDDAPVYVNPHGLVFELVLVRHADGAVPVSAPDPDFSWFAHTAWQIGLCRGCAHHVGWRYVSTATAAPFWGLIRDHVVDE